MSCPPMFVTITPIFFAPSKNLCWFSNICAVARGLFTIIFSSIVPGTAKLTNLQGSIPDLSEEKKDLPSSTVEIGRKDLTSAS